MKVLLFLAACFAYATTSFASAENNNSANARTVSSENVRECPFAKHTNTAWDDYGACTNSNKKDCDKAARTNTYENSQRTF